MVRKCLAFRIEPLCRAVRSPYPRALGFAELCAWKLHKTKKEEKEKVHYKVDLRGGVEIIRRSSCTKWGRENKKRSKEETQDQSFAGIGLSLVKCDSFLLRSMDYLQHS